MINDQPVQSFFLACGPLCPLCPEPSSLSWPDERPRFLQVLYPASLPTGSLSRLFVWAKSPLQQSKNHMILKLRVLCLISSLLPKAWEATRDMCELRKQRHRDRNASEAEVRQGRETQTRRRAEENPGMSEGWPGTEATRPANEAPAQPSFPAVGWGEEPAWPCRQNKDCPV